MGNWVRAELWKLIQHSALANIQIPKPRAIAAGLPVAGLEAIVRPELFAPTVDELVGYAQQRNAANKRGPLLKWQQQI